MPGIHLRVYNREHCQEHCKGCHRPDPPHDREITPEQSLFGVGLLCIGLHGTHGAHSSSG
jgi:hypothetical protein